jgi:F-type H+-transporting ATPase subunit a
MHIEIGVEKIFHIGSFFVTNSLLLVWVVIGLLILITQLMYRKISIVPNKLQNLFELAIETLLESMAMILGSRQKAIKYFPLIATLFILILISNWMGILPGVGSIGIWEKTHEAQKLVPFLRSPASDLNFTLGLAFLTIITINILGVRALGLKVSIKRYLNFSSPINFFIGILELIGEIAKIVSLSFRLFGNVFAGEVLLIITGFLVPYFVPIPFLGLEIFAGFIQALVFSTLTIVFLSLLTDETAAHH